MNEHDTTATLIRGGVVLPMEGNVDPAHAVVTPEIARAASYLAYTEGLRFRTTSVLDMWRYMEGSAEAATALGTRATLAPYVADVEGYDYFESIDSNRALLETHGWRR